MKNTSRFFQNLECEYYPCHETEVPINCLFCYCPLYPRENCPGNCKTVTVNEKTVKDCMGCSFPHDPENYDIIMDLLSKRM